MKQEGQEFRERMNYIITEEGKYVGSLVNIPGCGSQGDTLKELENNLHSALSVFIKLFQEANNLDFDCVQVTKEEFLK